VVPCVLALLPGRSAIVYKHLFQLLDEEATQLHMRFEPSIITSDFEQGLIAAVKNHVCFFSLILYFKCLTYFLSYFVVVSCLSPRGMLFPLYPKYPPKDSGTRTVESVQNR
jgi:hypothetical protein